MNSPNMYKITKGDKLFFADNYASAEKVFNRTKNTKYPCGAFTRLYCDLGAGYDLMRVHSKSIGRA